jgi:hypothetical protein
MASWCLSVHRWRMTAVAGTRGGEGSLGSSPVMNTGPPRDPPWRIQNPFGDLVSYASFWDAVVLRFAGG